MNVRTISHDGAVVFWSAGPTSRDLLNARLQNLGLEKFTPNPTTDESALKAALKDYAQSKSPTLKPHGRDKIVEKHRRRADGFDVVDVERKGKDESNDYVVDFAARVEQGQVVVSKGYANVYELQERFHAHKEALTGAQASGAMVKLMAHLGGTCLKDEGGVYWLPGKAIEAWDQVIAAFEETGATTKVYRMVVAMDMQTIRAVRDAITKEVSTAAGTLIEEIKANDFRDSALERRRQTALALRERVREYEAILGEALSHLHVVLDVAEQAAAGARAVQEDDAVFAGVF
jgi:hypothetical protein